jgi:hypothetical protein
MAPREFAPNVGRDGGHAERFLLGGARQFAGQPFGEQSTARSNGVGNDQAGEILGGGVRGSNAARSLERFAIKRKRKALSIPLLVAFSYANRVSASAEQGFGAENALVGQEAFLVDARDRIAKHVVAARNAARRASTVSKPALSTVMDHRPGGSTTKASLGGAVPPPLGVGELRPSQNCGRDRSCR